MSSHTCLTLFLLSIQSPSVFLAVSDFSVFSSLMRSLKMASRGSTCGHFSLTCSWRMRISLTRSSGVRPGSVVVNSSLQGTVVLVELIELLPALADDAALLLDFA